MAVVGLFRLSSRIFVLRVKSPITPHLKGGRPGLAEGLLWNPEDRKKGLLDLSLKPMRCCKCRKYAARFGDMSSITYIGPTAEYGRIFTCLFWSCCSRREIWKGG